ncbi:putative bifunctional diguanylate cyclase/phosphodiesterase [Peteryoungia ipomoeae]|uniref:EAL domain-containing protein n=1 Tax=Peteryoungia ipomoeae TaxID=1210932 RepID=A0A4V4HN47_9HYPH|nr:bifunctional diguanylate cyclase/phosphodiesterase [Peteryoungia ipomoeae]THV24696.1 EAL domain-containing protein [Peteryoungia ipomoeae]
MYSVISCIAVDHDPVLLIVAVLVCVLGSHLTMRLFGRVRNTVQAQRVTWIVLTSFIGGATIWSTHFIAMLGYRSDVVVGYEPVATLSSLVLSVAVTGAGFAIAALTSRGPLVEAGGVVLGLGIAAMHYVGMSGYEVQGELAWNTAYTTTSLIASALFGALATSRIARPLTRFCRHGATLAMILAIALTHFIGMTGVTILPDAAAAMPENVLPQNMLSVVVVAVAMIILTIGAMTYSLDRQSHLTAVERYRHMSLHDALTGLPNRAAFMERLADLIDRPRVSEGPIYVLAFDLDRFKEVNDVHGHAAGDHVLRVVSERLAQRLKSNEFVARIGGDEFVAVSAAVYTKEQAEVLARRFVEDLSIPIEWEQQSLSIGTSIGISVYPQNAESMDDLLGQADTAMYRAKAEGSNNIRFFDENMDLAARERNALAMDLRSALIRQEFELFYQKQNDTHSGEIVGFEVLLRWKHPERGYVSPVEFIPIAERSGLIVELGSWVLREACREAASWRRPLRIAVNVAPKQLATFALPAQVRSILQETGLDPHRLELEITESGIIEDQQHALNIIRQLKAIGVKIAMDDYGTGYSSLSTLQLFPFDKIKIDRAFIDGVTENRQSAAIVRSTIILAQSLDIPVLAEGVERLEHLHFLREEGCGQVQGYFYGRPEPVEMLQDIVNPPDLILADLEGFLTTEGPNPTTKAA